ncbi:MAG: hypothetical protein NWF14_04830 [Candidatus Bathyarchaeota archaeon]|nr:hypothetical protein [Candidatus Bathyarchaeota archaeon]
MDLKHISSKASRIAFLLLAVSSLTLNSEPLVSVVSAQSSGSFSYEFIVDEDGFTLVNIVYRSGIADRSSWVLVPKFSGWTNQTAKGEVTAWSLNDTESLTGVQYYFYEALVFSFTPDGSEFEMNIQFNLSTAAMIIEPNGIFYSPQIGFEQGNNLEATVIFPEGFTVKTNEAFAFGSSGSYLPNSSGSSSGRVLFDSIPATENLMRIEIGFRTLNQTAELREFKNGVFTFEAIPRYEEYAHKILDLYNETYNSLVALFNVTLDGAQIRFFLPDFNSLLSVGGYVPFSSDRMGDIHVNIVFTRYVEGYIEVIALHELVHHFLWKAGISPGSLLWFHEGMTQYVSMDAANKIGYEGAEMMKQELEDGIVELKQMIGENFGYLRLWSPSSQPQNTGSYYIAAYYVVSRLAEPRGGLEYYARFFKAINGETVESNAALGYYLSLVANESVVETLNGWGLEIIDLYEYSPLLEEARNILNDVDPVFQPYKFLAEWLYRQAFLNARADSISTMHLYLTAAILVARFAPLLMLITVSAVLFGAILWVLKKEGVFSNY